MNARVEVGGTSPELMSQRMASIVMAVGRLAPGVSLSEADAQVEAVYAGLAEAYPASNANRSG
jgi:hypothetical protein